MSRIPSVLCIVCILGLLPLVATGQSADELREQISSHAAEIDKLNAEIEQYERQLTDIGSKKQTLQSTLNTLDLQRKQLNAKISVTKNSIESLLLQIQTLDGSISDKQVTIEKDNQAIAAAINRLREADEITLAEHILGSGSISRIWDEVETVKRFQDAVSEHIVEVTAIKEELTVDRDASVKKQKELEGERQKLVGQQTSLEINRREQAALLTQTKNQESSYQKLLADKQAARQVFEQTLNELESRLEYTLDPSRLPPAGKGILRWPLDAVKITQYFGNTEFAKSGAYSGKGHNGVDFRAAIGTPVKAALSGTVEGSGNTDSIRGCYSYGRWVLVKHSNGLSSLYAHLSQSNVSRGDEVKTGQILGYSGNTGYSTGPHLHFSVYASNGVRVMKLGESTGRVTPCANAEIPVSPLGAYLNPLDYL